MVCVCVLECRNVTANYSLTVFGEMKGVTMMYIPSCQSLLCVEACHESCNDIRSGSGG